MADKYSVVLTMDVEGEDGDWGYSSMLDCHYLYNGEDKERAKEVMDHWRSQADGFHETNPGDAGSNTTRGNTPEEKE